MPPSRMSRDGGRPRTAGDGRGRSPAMSRRPRPTKEAGGSLAKRPPSPPRCRRELTTPLKEQRPARVRRHRWLARARARREHCHQCSERPSGIPALREPHHGSQRFNGFDTRLRSTRTDQASLACRLQTPSPLFERPTRALCSLIEALGHHFRTRSPIPHPEASQRPARRRWPRTSFIGIRLASLSSMNTAGTSAKSIPSVVPMTTKIGLA